MGMLERSGCALWCVISILGMSRPNSLYMNHSSLRSSPSLIARRMVEATRNFRTCTSEFAPFCPWAMIDFRSFRSITRYNCRILRSDSLFILRIYLSAFARVCLRGMITFFIMRLKNRLTNSQEI